MDVLSHIAAGAATGSYFGRPFLGALIAVIPDMTLPLRRVPRPPVLYDTTHCLLFVISASVTSALVGPDGWLMFWCLMSHLVLDAPTHGKDWAPQLLYPLSGKRFSFGQEWEWFNRSWWRGLLITLGWIFVWLSLGTGFRS